MPASKSLFYLSVSEIAAAVGRNRYRPPEQVLADRYRKEFPEKNTLMMEILTGSPLVLAREAVKGALASQRFAQAKTEENAPKRARIAEEVVSSALEQLSCTLDSANQKALQESEEASKLVEELQKSVEDRGAECAKRKADEVAVREELRGLEARVEDGSSKLAFLEASLAAARDCSLEEEAHSLEFDVAEKKRQALELKEHIARTKLEHADAVQRLREAEGRLEFAKAEFGKGVDLEQRAKQREREVVALTRAAPSFVKSEIKSAVQTHVGITQESAAVAAVTGFEPADGPLVYGTYTCGKYRFRFGGKCDGRKTTTGELLEVKTRQNRFMGLPVYEEIQVLAYLFIYNQERCFFREVLQGETKEDRLVTRDDARLRSLIDEGLLELMRKWERMCSDETYCLDVLRSHPAKQ